MAVHAVPASKASQAQNQYRFKVPGTGGKVWALPLLRFLPVQFKERMAAAAKPIAEAEEAGREPSTAEKHALGELAIDLLNRYAPGLTAVVDDEQLAFVLRGWFEASGISVGESLASATS